MWKWAKNKFKYLSLAQRFMLASLFTLVLGMSGIGWWVGSQIETKVIHQTAAATALYVDSFVTPNLQEVAQSDTLTPEHIAMLNKLVKETSFGQQVVSLKIWGRGGRVLYSTRPDLIGQVFPVEPDLKQAWEGQVTSKISELEKDENIEERSFGPRLIETYSPVRLESSNQIISVIEFYQKVDPLQQEIGTAQQQSWLIVGIATLVMYLLLAGFVQRASNTIKRQQHELGEKVSRLTQLLNQNKTLHQRVRRAAARTTAVNERFLRRVSAELHDGPAQDVSLALLRLDHVYVHCSACTQENSEHQADLEDLEIVQNSLRHALQEVRAISGGLGLPQLNNLTLSETVERVIRSHERRTKSKVSLELGTLPTEASLPVKITLYRVIQEALNNAFRYAAGVGQQVCLDYKDHTLWLEITDQGPGFDRTQEDEWDKHLGLVGMRERIESLGGTFEVDSRPGQGTRIKSQLALQAAEGTYD
ncbi:MAG TPA: sensor histidine kinase [Chloroflexia bacterium]|nr:sensor histidine kinase [Chloroflexia bacterium]